MLVRIQIIVVLAQNRRARPQVQSRIYVVIGNYVFKPAALNGFHCYLHVEIEFERARNNALEIRHFNIVLRQNRNREHGVVVKFKLAESSQKLVVILLYELFG